MISPYINPNFQPRPYQKNAVNALMSCQKGLVHSPTGSGKTNIMAYLIAKSQKTALVIVPAIDLISQTKDRFKAILDPNTRIGTLGGGTTNRADQIDSDILITTWQSLGVKNSNILHTLRGKHQMIIVDECHHASADVLFGVVNFLSPYAEKLYGVSATPYRSSRQDEQKLLSLFGNNLAYRVSVDDLYNDGFLVRPNINVIKVGNYNLGSIAEEKIVKNMLNKKLKANTSYSEFIDDALKIGYVVVNNITKEPAFKMYELTKTMPNGNIKSLDSYDITALKNFLKDCFYDISDDNEKKKNLARNIIKTMRTTIDPSFFRTNSTLSKEKQEEMIYNLGRINSVFAKSILAKQPKSSPYNWDNIGQKIGYLKKSIDEDFIRQEQIEYFLKQDLENRDNIKAIILTNSISWGKKICDKFQKLFPNATFYYVEGHTKNKQDVFECVRNEQKNFVLVSTTALIKEGIDLPNVNCVYQLSPVFNPIHAIYSTEQIIGRAIRPAPNKNNADIFIFDAYTTDFSNRRAEIFDTINKNVLPSVFLFFNGLKNYSLNYALNLKANKENEEMAMEKIHGTINL